MGQRAYNLPLKTQSGLGGNKKSWLLLKMKYFLFLLIKTTANKVQQYLLNAIKL